MKRQLCQYRPGRDAPWRRLTAGDFLGFLITQSLVNVKEPESFEFTSRQISPSCENYTILLEFLCEYIRDGTIRSRSVAPSITIFITISPHYTGKGYQALRKCIENSCTLTLC